MKCSIICCLHLVAGPHLAVSRIQRVNHNLQDTYPEVGMSLFNYLIKCLKGRNGMGNSVN